MHNLIDLIMVVLMLVNLALCSSSRLSSYILLVAGQGAALGLLPILASGGVSLRTALIAALTVAVKGLLFPYLLARAIRGVNIRREVEPFVGYGISVIIGIVITAMSFGVGNRLPLPELLQSSSLILPAAVSSMLTGLFLLISRRKAITQVLGYLVMENGIVAFGLTVVAEIPWLIELGILMDAFVAVFVMTVMIYHINREFNHIDADQLSALKG